MVSGKSVINIKRITSTIGYWTRSCHPAAPMNYCCVLISDPERLDTVLAISGWDLQRFIGALVCL